MESKQFIEKIKIYALISFFLPLITINLCLVVFKFLGDFSFYPNYTWDEKIIKHTPQKEYEINNDGDSWSFTNCPKYEFKKYAINTDNEIVEIKINDNPLDNTNIKFIIQEQGNTINKRCVKSQNYKYLLLTKVKILEKFLIVARKNNNYRFGKVENPYLYGEVSISRTARYYPATLIFKPFVILSALFLMLYWINNLKFFKELENKNILVKPERKFFYFGIISCIFLILHASFLGVDLESELFQKFRRVVIVTFILFEIAAQVSLTNILFKNKLELKKYINTFILKIKIAFISLILLITIVVFAFLIWGDLETSHKHVIEWNYFSALLIYYLLSRLLWSWPKTQVHTPEGA